MSRVSFHEGGLPLSSARVGGGRHDETISYASDIGVLGILQIITRLRGLILLPVIANSMGTAAYGVWTQSLGVVATGSAVIAMQLPAALVRFVSGSRTRDKQRAYLIPQVLVLIVLGVLVALILAMLPEVTSSLVFGDASYSPIARWLGVWIALATLSGLGLDLQRGLHHVKRYGVLTTAQILIQLVIVAGAIVLTRNLLTAVLSAIVLEAITAIGILGLGLGETGLSWPGMGRFRESLAFSLPLVPSYYGGVVLSFADRLLIAWQLGPEAVGIYTAAYSLARAVGEIFRPIRAALVPAASRLWDQGDVEGGEDLLTNTFRYYLILAVPALAGVALLGPTLLIVLANQVTANLMSWIVAALGLGFMFNNLQSVFGILLQLDKDTRPLAISKALSAVTFVAMVTYAVPRWGLIGGGASTALGYGLDLAITASLAWRRHPLVLPVRSAAKAVLAAGCMSLVVLAVRGEGLTRLLLGVVAGMAAYGFFIVAFRGVGRKEFRFLWAVIKPRSGGGLGEPRRL